MVCFQKKIIQVNFKTLYCCNFVQKLTKIEPVDFQKHEKPHLGPILGLLRQKPQKKDQLLQKNSAAFNFQ